MRTGYERVDAAIKDGRDNLGQERPNERNGSHRIRIDSRRVGRRRFVGEMRVRRGRLDWKEIHRDDVGQGVHDRSMDCGLGQAGVEN